MTRFQKVLLAIVIVILVLLVGGIILYVGKNELSSPENVLLNVLLTVFSVFLSIIISQFYFDSSRQKTIEEIKRDNQSTTTLYAQKAAEKVDNLSSELTKLSIYLQQDEDRELDPRTLLLLREEKIRSAIHIIETLKSINDKSLSDWRGVIPEEELDEQNEARTERESEFIQVLDSYSRIISGQSSNITITGTGGEIVPIHEELGDLSKKIDKLATSIIGTPIKKTPSITKKQDVQTTCPECDSLQEYRQRPTKSSRKVVVCKNCSSSLVSIWNGENGFQLNLPSVEDPISIQAKPVPEEILLLIKKTMPAQPWPKGASEKVAGELGINRPLMKRGVNELIKRGEFKQQIDGVLVDSTPPSKIDLQPPNLTPQ